MEAPWWTCSCYDMHWSSRRWHANSSLSASIQPAQTSFSKQWHYTFRVQPIGKELITCFSQVYPRLKTPNPLNTTTVNLKLLSQRSLMLFWAAASPHCKASAFVSHYLFFIFNQPASQFVLLASSNHLNEGLHSFGFGLQVPSTYEKRCEKFYHFSSCTSEYWFAIEFSFSPQKCTNAP